MASETAEQDELEAQFQTATEELQRAVMRLFQGGDIHPHLVVLALARVTGEVGGARRGRVSRTPRRCWASWPRSCAGPGGSSGRRCGPKPCQPRGTPEHPSFVDRRHGRPRPTTCRPPASISTGGGVSGQLAAAVAVMLAEDVGRGNGRPSRWDRPALAHRGYLSGTGRLRAGPDGMSERWSISIADRSQVPASLF